MFGWFIGRNKGFQPNTFPDLQLWLDATRINQSDNTAVATWADQSGKGYNAEQSTTAARPTYIASGLNGLPVVRFDGTDDTMPLVSGALGMFKNVAGATIFAVAKYPANSISNFTFFASKNDSFARIALLQQTDNKIAIGGRRLDANSFQSVATSASITNNFLIHSGIANYQNTLLQNFVNGALDGQKTDFQTSGDTSNTDSLIIYVGSSNFLGDIAEIIVYNRALNTSELAQVHRYLARKWGIALA